LVYGFLAATLLLEEPARLALVVGEREQKKLRSDELIAPLLGFLVGEVEREIAFFADSRSRGAFTPARESSDAAVPPSCASNAASRCAGSMNWWSWPSAMLCASASASWNFVVSLSKRMARQPGLL
jgi:hypothetical protein